MKIYRVHYWDMKDSSLGYEFFSRRESAERAYRNNSKKSRDFASMEDSIEVIELTKTKKGLLQLLNSIASHPNNG